MTSRSRHLWQVAPLLAVVLILAPASVRAAVPAKSPAGGAAGGNHDRPASPTTLPSVEEIERRVLASRRAIESAEFKIEEKRDTPNPHADVQSHVWIAPGGLVRQENEVTPPGRAAQHQVLIYGATTAFHYSGGPEAFANPDRAQRRGVHTWAVEEARRGGVPYAVCDPRMIMFVPVPYGITYTHTLESLVSGPGRENLRAWAAEFEGLSVFTISFDTPKTGNHCEYDVAPSRGYNIVRWRLEWGNQGVNGQAAGVRNTFDCLMTCKLKQVADGVWFPSTVELDETRNDKPYSKEVLKVQVLSLNQRIDEKLFTLAGLPPDVVVSPEPPISQDPRRAQAGAAAGPPPKRPPLMLWDGKVVRPFTDEDGMAIQASHRQPQPTAGSKPAAERPTSRQAND